MQNNSEQYKRNTNSATPSFYNYEQECLWCKLKYQNPFDSHPPDIC